MTNTKKGVNIISETRKQPERRKDMKVYGANKATEFTKKQISIIYGAAKRGELKLERWVASDLYDLADYYGYDDNGAVARAEVKVLAILDAVFGKDMAKAQELIDEYTESTFEALSRKAQDKANRSLVA